MIAKEFDQAVLVTKIEESIKPIIEEINNKYEELKDAVEIEVGEDKVTIRMMGATTFDTGKAELHPAFRPLLKKIGEVLSQTKGEIIIAGHTDNVPLSGGLFGSNLGLSMARAGSAAEFMLRSTSIDPKKLSTMGFGEYRPLDSNDTAQGRRRNRRVEIIVSN
jgi:chemotaxis protein MotB